jgi:seryl-tRNA synthetase
MNATTEEKLDMLAEYYSQKDVLELNKRALLDDVKIPDEVLQVMNEGNARTQEYEANQRHIITKVNEECDAKLKEIVIPDEIKAALAEIDRQRALVEAYRNGKAAELRDAMMNKRNEIHAEVEAKTKDVYVQVAQRKSEIEAEFSGKAEDVEANIRKLEAEIKAEVKDGKKSIKGNFFHAVYVSGRITWNTDKMEAWLVDHPFLKDARKEGEPSVTLRKI